MATFVAQLQKNFKLTLQDGIPQAVVEQQDGVYWMKCCPLCGSVHQVQTMTEGEPYTPFCQTHDYLFKAELAAWHKLFPDVIPYKTLHLVNKTS